MKAKILVAVALSALSTGGLSYGQFEAEGLPLPSDGILELPGYLTGTWQSVQMSSSLTRVDPSTVNRTLTLSGEIPIKDCNNLIGLSTSSPAATANDELGRVYTTPSSVSPYRFYRMPAFLLSIQDCNKPVVEPNIPIPVTTQTCRSVTTTYPERFSLAFPMDPNRGYPLLLTEVKWDVYVLLAESFQYVDLPFAASSTWYQVKPNLQVMIEKAVSGNGTYTYQIKGKYDGVSPFGSLSLRPGQGLPAYFIQEIAVLDAKGQSMRNSGSGGFSSGVSAGGGTFTAFGSGQCDLCGEVKTLRLVIANGPFEAKVPFVLTNIPVPTF